MMKVGENEGVAKHTRKMIAIFSCVHVQRKLDVILETDKVEFAKMSISRRLSFQNVQTGYYEKSYYSFIIVALGRKSFIFLPIFIFTK